MLYEVITEVYLTGYSLGGSQAAFLAKLDEARGELRNNFV